MTGPRPHTRARESERTEERCSTGTGCTNVDGSDAGQAHHAVNLCAFVALSRVSDVRQVESGSGAGGVPRFGNTGAPRADAY